jgi:hypothetical protein
MRIYRNILTIIVSVAIAAAGLPAQAGTEYCPMAAHMQQDAKAGQSDKDCPGCTMTSKQEQKKSGCCDNGACIVKCSATGNIASNVPTKVELPIFTAMTVKFYMADGVSPSSLLQTQDRPPKHLS